MDQPYTFNLDKSINVLYSTYILIFKNNKNKNLYFYLSNLSFDAPIFERSISMCENLFR